MRIFIHEASMVDISSIHKSHQFEAIITTQTKTLEAKLEFTI